MIPRFLFFILISYILVVALVYIGQRYLQYAPDKNYPGKPKANGVPEMKEIKVKTEDGLELLAWFAPPKEKHGKIIVYYHGNAGNIAERAFKAKEFIKAGYGVYFCEYRGFGSNAGSPSEEGFYKDGRAALKWLDGNDYPPSQWVIYGESIGSGVAVQMALEFQPKELIIEAGFSSAIDLGKKMYPWLPVSYMLKDKFDNISKIKLFKGSVLVFHGDKDKTTNILFGKKLYEAANNPKEFVTINGAGHGDLFDFKAGELVINWLKNKK